MARWCVETMYESHARSALVIVTCATQQYFCGVARPRLVWRVSPFNEVSGNGGEVLRELLCLEKGDSNHNAYFPEVHRCAALE